MRQKRLRVSVAILCALGISGMQAQESLNTSGGDAAGSGGSVSYSVGQVFYTTNTASEGSVAQGVQHAYEIYVLGIEEVEGIDLSIAAYPNPTAEYLTLEVKDSELSDLTFRLYDIQGRVLQSQRITANQTMIAMGNLTVATYFLKVSQGDKEVKTFKVLKN